MSHRLRLVVDEEVRGAGHELELQAGGSSSWKPDGILRDQPVLRAEQHDVGMRSRRPQQLPRMIVINSGGMSCRYSADAARGRGGLAQHGEVRGDIFVEG